MWFNFLPNVKYNGYMHNTELFNLQRQLLNRHMIFFNVLRHKS